MGSAYQRTFNALQRHIAAINARGILDRAARANGFSAHDLTSTQLRTILPDLQRGISLFVEPQRQGILRNELEMIAGTADEIDVKVVRIEGEHHISAARSAAREMCQSMGARPTVVQRLSTMVSELARNIVNYTPGGEIHLEPLHQPVRRIVVTAIDSGSGIPHLQRILNGSYRSRTGMGMGLIGSKRLADRFDIDTGPRGTRIVAEVTL